MTPFDNSLNSSAECAPVLIYVETVPDLIINGWGEVRFYLLGVVAKDISGDDG